MLVLQETYRKRPIRFLELWEHDDWRLKVYGITYQGQAPRAHLVEKAKALASERLPALADTQGCYGVGFLGVHDGRRAEFLFLDWWADENELHHHVYVASHQQPDHFEYVTPLGLIACVWDCGSCALSARPGLSRSWRIPWVLILTTMSAYGSMKRPSPACLRVSATRKATGSSPLPPRISS